MQFPLPKNTASAACIVAGLVAGACSATPPPQSATLAAGQTPSGTAGGTAGAYQLTAEETALDCKKLTGRMQVRILQARDYQTQPKTTAASQVMQQAVSTVGGGISHGMDPAGDHAKDRAQLEAYNQRLASLNCKTFNLDEDLKPKASTETPRPVDKSASGTTTADGRTNVTIPIDKIGKKPTAQPN
jgi:hypothetical protein